MCDASAAVALTDELFAVASDEDSVIRVYSREQGGALRYPSVSRHTAPSRPAPAVHQAM